MTCRSSTKPTLIRFGFFAVMTAMLSMSGCQKAAVKRPVVPPAPIGQVASEAGFEVFDFPRFAVKPGTIVQMNPDGRLIPSPAGSLHACRAGVGGGSDPSLNIKREERAGGKGRSLVDRWTQLRLEDLERILPIQFRPEARSAAYVVMKAPRAFSESLGPGQIEQWLSNYWDRLSDPCRKALTDPDKATLDEVIYADGFALSFLSADFKTIDLSSIPLGTLLEGDVDAVRPRIEGYQLTFNTLLPYGYTLHQSCRFFDPARLSEDSYRRCVRGLQPTVQTPILAEAVRRLKGQYTSVLITASAQEPSAEQFRTIHSLIDFLLAVDPLDGHGLYYRGEAERLLYRKDRNGAGYLGSHASFNQYLKNLEILSQENTTREINCADDALGYCSERTAWVAHLLAQDFYRTSFLKTKGKRQEDLCQAARQAAFVLKIRGSGFDGALHWIPTEELIQRVGVQLERLQLGACP